MKSKDGDSSIRKTSEHLLSHLALEEFLPLFQCSQLFQTALHNKEKRDEGEGTHSQLPLQQTNQSIIPARDSAWY